MDRLQKLKERKCAVAGEMKAILEASEDPLTQEEQEKFDALKAEGESLNTQIENFEVAMKAEAEAERMKNRPAPKLDPIVPQGQVHSGLPEDDRPKVVVVPSTCSRVGKLKAFKSDERAYKFGQWVRAANGIASASQWCNDHGILMQAVHQENTNTTGGYLVPEEFSRDLVDLRLQYGVFRRNTRVRNMTGDTLVFPRRTSGLTAYFVGESSEGTESDKAWDQIKLVARKLMALTRMSNELAEDAIISVADDLANEIAYAFAHKEDLCGFLGDGTSTYGGITGVNVALKAAAGTPTDTSAGGVVVGAGNLYSELDLGDFEAVLGVCPTYARMGAKWYCSPKFFYTVMAKLIHSAGGATQTERENGVSERFLGYPVELSEVMPTTQANSQVCCLFGNLAQASSMGDRRQTTLSFSDSATVGSQNVFERDEIAVKGTERMDINVHDVGNSTTAGPIVGLQTLNA